MRVLYCLLLTFLSYAQAQEVLCDARSLAPLCTLPSGASSFSVLPNYNNQVTKTNLTQDAGQVFNFTTLSGSLPVKYFVNVENENPVSLNFDLSARAQSPSPAELVPDASSLVLTAGKVTTLNLNVSGYQGQNGKNFSEVCAADVTQGIFGADSLSDFINSRASNPNLPVNQCTAEDLFNIALRQRSGFCPSGTQDLNEDNLLNPSFQITRLQARPYCKKQTDVRQCLIQGQRQRCGIRYFRHVTEDNFLPVAVAPSQVYTYNGIAVHAVVVDNHTDCGTVGFPPHTQCTQETDVRWDFPTAEFYTVGAPSAADHAFYCGSLTIQSSVQPGVDISFASQATGLYSYFPQGTTGINDQPQTSNKYCETYAFENYFNPSRGLLNLTHEIWYNPLREYQYSPDSLDPLHCPTPWTLETFDQNHNNPEWSETITCTPQSCPNTLLSIDRSDFSYRSFKLSSSQPGANKGKGSVFAYDVLATNFIQQPGTNGRLSLQDLEQTEVIKNCVDVKDLSNASNVTEAQAKRPVIILHQINYKAYSVTDSDPVAGQNFTTNNTIDIYKKIDSSARDWISKSADPE